MTHDNGTINYINDHPEQHLRLARKRVNGRPTYICPFCDNGSGSEGTGLTSKDGQHWKCFKCGFYGDMITLIAKERGITDSNSREAIEAAKEIYGIADEMQYTDYKPTTDKAQPAQETDSTDYDTFLQEHCKPGCNMDYLQSRGISRETGEALGFGYNEKTKAVVIPVTTTSGRSYIERYTEDNGSGRRYHIAKGSKRGLFNAAALELGEPVYITEGAIDAASLIEVGGAAVAINSTANAQGFVDYIKEAGCKATELLICMDNDPAGETAKAILLQGLKELGIPCKAVKLFEGYKDANEALQGDRGKLAVAVAKYSSGYDEDLEDFVNSHKVGAYLEDFWSYVHDAANNTPILTGFPHLDAAIGGGLLPRFYVIGAQTSVGKTAFVLQILDNVAKAGNDVLIFSLEMPKEDLIARSISRNTYLLTQQPGSGYSVNQAKTELGILQGSRYRNYTQTEARLILEARRAYADYAAEHISIYEGRHTVDQVRQTVEQYISVTGKRPVVAVDYLQILQPTKELMRATVREQVDYSVDVLASMRRDLKTPVIGISSFNRNSYSGEADNRSFKESGTIEYSGDCTILLDLDFVRATGANKEDENRRKWREAMRSTPRKVKLTFEKNRGNKVGTVLYFRYDPRFNLYEPDWEKDDIQ